MLRKDRKGRFKAYVEHIVSPGERLDNIAYLHYGNPYLWEPILVINPHLIEVDYPKAGTTIRVPVFEQSAPERTQKLALPLWRRTNTEGQNQ